jgi:hypothetical protein
MLLVIIRSGVMAAHRGGHPEAANSGVKNWMAGSKPGHDRKS